ncbi:MAG TPA: FAD-dependent oxidoreductase, partial [Burkholderiales bacterium]|nr:FAD-dependent oxidoreductase [Burkholderiales bacterium]
CAERGMRVTVVERNGERRDGCSYGNTGMVVPSHFVPLAAPGMVALALKWMWNPASPFYIKPRASFDLARWGFQFMRAANAAHVSRAAPLLARLHMESRALYEKLAAETNFHFEKRGVLVLCRTEHALEEEAALVDQARALGLRAEVLDKKRIELIEPGMRIEALGAVHIAEDCNVEPRVLMEALQRKCAAAGVEFHWNTEAGPWRTAGDRILGLGELEADEFVLAAGSWSPPLARSLGLRLPMQAGKGYSLTLERPRRSPRTCAVLSEARVSVSPMNGSLRFGGTMELAGLDETINPIRVRGIIQAVQRYFPDFGPADFEGVQPWRGLRPCTPDGLPYVGRTARAENLVVATGHAMMGVSLGPVTGKLVAAVLSGEKSHNLLSPDRYD